MADACDHPHGGEVPGLPGFVCGKCWSLLEKRPVRYGMVTLHGVAVAGGSEPLIRQDIIWRAPERTGDGGITLGQFVVALAQRFSIRASMQRPVALVMALGVLRDLASAGVIGEFGDQECEWSRGSAKDIADEEMAYWDQDGGVGNA